ncbi:MAG: hypothetical protein WC378_17445 [Opitutaceae bacterium]|jgi:hypothetical protein
MSIKIPKHPYDATQALYAGRSVIQLVRAATFTTGAISTAGIVTMADHGLKVNAAVRFKSGTAGEGLTADTIYYVVASEAGTFTLSSTYGGAAVVPTTAYTDAVFAKVHIFGTKLVTPKAEQETTELQEPGDDGISHTVDSRVKSVKETYEFEVPETKRILEIFDKKLAGILDAYATLIVPDPQADEDGTVALASEEFHCKVTKSGDQKWGDGEFDKATLVLTNLESSMVEWDADVTIEA